MLSLLQSIVAIQTKHTRIQITTQLSLLYPISLRHANRQLRRGDQFSALGDAHLLEAALWPLHDERVRELARLMWPFILVNILTRCTPLLERYFASGLPDGDLSYPGYATKVTTIIMNVLIIGNRARKLVRYPLDTYNREPAIDDKLVLQADVPYIFKLQVQSRLDDVSIYRVKVWEQGSPEPEGWLLEGYGRPFEDDDNPGELQAGSVGLITYYTDASFGNVSIRPLPAP